MTYSCDIDWDLQKGRKTLAIRLGKKNTKSYLNSFLWVGVFLCLFLLTFFQEILFFYLGVCYLWLFTANLGNLSREPFKSFCELSYLPLSLPFLLNFFSSDWESELFWVNAFLFSTPDRNFGRFFFVLVSFPKSVRVFRTFSVPNLRKITETIGRSSLCFILF